MAKQEKANKGLFLTLGAMLGAGVGLLLSSKKMRAKMTEVGEEVLTKVKEEQAKAEKTQKKAKKNG